MVVGVDDVALLNNGHECSMLTCGFKGCHPRMKGVILDGGEGGESLASTYTLLYLLLPINNFVFVCAVLVLFLALVLLMS
jgi:hypothetical protein